MDGNIGNLYIAGEQRRRDLIELFPNNKIISFPQSIDFKDTKIGQKEFEISSKIYENNKNLIIFSREDRSYNIMKNHFKNKVELVPDIVLYLAGKLEINKNLNRDKILICFRDDKEKVVSKCTTYKLIDLLEKNNFKDIELIDTHLGGNVEFKPDEKEKLFEKVITKFSQAKFVITDRLHGMIFSLITKTPCIAFDTSNHKVSSTYKTWLKNIPYIKFLKDFEETEIINSIKEYIKIDTSKFDIDLTSKFKPLFEELEKLK